MAGKKGPAVPKIIADMRETCTGNGPGSVMVAIDPDVAADPQMVVAAAINDVLDLARAMSPAGDLSRGAVEMRRRLAIMDRALVLAERAGVLAQGQVEGNA